MKKIVFMTTWHSHFTYSYSINPYEIHRVWEGCSSILGVEIQVILSLSTVKKALYQHWILGLRLRHFRKFVQKKNYVKALGNNQLFLVTLLHTLLGQPKQTFLITFKPLNKNMFHCKDGSNPFIFHRRNLLFIAAQFKIMLLCLIDFERPESFQIT